MATVTLSAVTAAIATLQISLSQWGLQSVDEIGYVNVGVLHESTGDRVIVYNVARSAPTDKPAPAPMSQDPSPKAATFVVSHFDKGNRNALGGNFNVFMRAPARAEVFIGDSGENQKSLIFDFQKTQSSYAGFWIHLFDSQKPPSERIYFDSTAYAFLTFWVKGAAGDERFELRALDDVLERKEDSKSIGDVGDFLAAHKITTAWQKATVALNALPSSVKRKMLAGLVLQADEASAHGRLFVRDLAFSRNSEVALPASLAEAQEIQRPLSLGLWLWETQKIQSSPAAIKNLVGFCAKHKFTDIFVQVPYEATKLNGKWIIDWNEQATRPFVRALNQAGLKVHALDGGRDYALEANHGRQLELVKRIITFNARYADSRFYGLRYDDEVYLLPSYWGVEKDLIAAQYLTLLQETKALSSPAHLAFGVDVPFWFEASLMESILKSVDNIGLMDYRTVAYGADGVIAHAFNSLQLAQTMKKRVFVGLETVPLPNETLYEFGKSRTAKSLSLIRKIEVPSSKISFFGAPPASLSKVFKQSQNELSAYPSFAGMALHSYESLRPENGYAMPLVIE